MKLEHHNMLRRIPLALLAATFAVSAALGESVTLAWNPVLGAAGYRLHYGAASRSYTNHLDCGAATTAAVSNLVGGVTYYFAATCYDTNRAESGYSAEVSWWAPTAPQMLLSQALVRVPVAFWGSSNLVNWSVVGTNYAWMELPTTNVAGFFKAQMLPLIIGREP